MQEYFKSKIRDIHNFPKEGIIFKDISTLIKDPEAFNKMGEQLHRLSMERGIEKVIGIDSRGFIYGGYLAYKLDAGFVIIRKSGKLPGETIKQKYALEYGEACLEIHKDAIVPGEKVLVHDDLLATGGTAKAACDLVEKMGGVVVQVTFMVELSFLKGREKFNGYKVDSVVVY